MLSKNQRENIVGVGTPLAACLVLALVVGIVWDWRLAKFLGLFMVLLLGYLGVVITVQWALRGWIDRGE